MKVVTESIQRFQPSFWRGMGNPATKMIPQMFELGGLFEGLGANFCTLSGSRNFGIKMTQIVSPA
jgi:hypothetical protein